jgi:hypothetical protein
MLPDRITFTPLRFCWAAMHPNPQGIAFLIGGAFFGTFPTIFYRALLSDLHRAGFTVVALPFRFSFRHWDVALSMARDHLEIRRELLQIARHKGHATELYMQSPTAPVFNDLWIGHSLGCKYIALLELLSDAEEASFPLLASTCLGPKQAELLTRTLQSVDLDAVSLLNQPSILLDPEISDLDSAIPWPPLRRLIGLFVSVRPTRRQSFCLIRGSRLFRLSSLLFFRSRLAADTVTRLEQVLAHRLLFRASLPLGRHLAALGWHSLDERLRESLMEAVARSRRGARAEASPPAAPAASQPHC